MTALLAASLVAPGFALANSAARVPAERAVIESGMPEESGTPESGILLAQAGGCYSIAEGIAAEYGGQIHTAEPQERNGQTVCVIIVLVPAKGGNRGQTVRRVVPLN